MAGKGKDYKTINKHLHENVNSGNNILVGIGDPLLMMSDSSLVAVHILFP